MIKDILWLMSWNGGNDEIDHTAGCCFWLLLINFITLFV